MRRLGTVMTVLIAVVLSSCVPVRKIIYLQPDSSTNSDKTFVYDRQDYLLQINDILDVQIKSMDPNVNAIFNAESKQSLQASQISSQTGGDLFYLTGYSLDGNGDITIPFVGKVNVLGLSVKNAETQIDSLIGSMFSNYDLKVKLGGIRFSALGEVNRPGKIVIMQNQATIFEAIALCGDLTQLANRENIKLIRQSPEGTHIHSINLLDQSVISSPFYFMHTNDVLYVEPLVQKSYGLGVNGAQTISTLVGVLSTSLAVILSVITLSQ